MKTWCNTAAILLAVTCVCAQESAVPIIRTETRTVLVDAVAVDKKGKFATDLSAKDFRVWEDGKEQKVTGFSLESSGVLPERPSRHYIVMFFDTTAGPAGQMAARQQAVRFVDGFASPDRDMAVINYSFDGGARVAQNFTADREALKKALSVAPASSGLTPGAPSAPAGRGGRNAPPHITPETAGYGYMLESLRNVAASLGNIRGRKALVLFTNGMPVSEDTVSDLDATIAACNKANVAVYTVAPGGGPVGSFAADGSNPTPTAGNTRGARGVQMPVLNTDDLATQSATGALSDGTGGLAFHTVNGLAMALGKVAQEQDQYYLLSYTPTAESAEGSCHELKVKVDRGDLEVRARKSYCTSKPADLLSGKPAGSALEGRAASAASSNITAKMQLPWFYTAPNVARVNLAMEIIPSAVKFQKEKGGKLYGEFDLQGVAYKADGTAAARVSDVVKLDFDTQQQVDAFLHAPYHYENQFEVAPGQYNFRMAIGSGPSDAQGFGKVEMPLTVEPWNGQMLALSGIALSHDAHPATDLAAGLDESLLEGQRPLIAKGAVLVPGGATQFHMGEPAYCYFEAYEPLLATAKAGGQLPLVGIRVRVLERATGQQKSDTGAKTASTYERAGNPAIPVIASLPTANLTAGEYRLEVSVMRENGAPVVRTADFEIN